MKISEKGILQIIREEATRLLRESEDFDGNTGMPSTPNGVAIKMKSILSAAQSGLTGNDRKLVNYILNAINPGDLDSAGFLQLVLQQINNEGVKLELMRARAKAQIDAGKRAGVERVADLAARGIKSFDPDTGKPVYSEGQTNRTSPIQEARAPGYLNPQQTFREIKKLIDEALMNKSFGIPGRTTDGYIKDLNKLIDYMNHGGQDIGDDEEYDEKKHGYGMPGPSGDRSNLPPDVLGRARASLAAKKRQF